MILVDTSAWIEFFRDRDPLASAVDALIEDKAVAVCGPVLTELARGLGSARERARVLPLLSACHVLQQPSLLWEEAGDLGASLARKGKTVKTLDLLIAIYALHHRVPILTGDRDFSLMNKAGIPLLLV